MKNLSFKNYLQESQHTYEFRIKIADVDPTDKMDRIENALNAYGMESLSKPKRLPLKESDIDFPSHGAVQLYLMDAVLTYPCNDAQVRQIIADRADIAKGNIKVVPKLSPEEIRRWNIDDESDIKEYKHGEAVLDKPYEDNPDATQAGDDYAKPETILKELDSPEIKTEKKSDQPEGNKGKTSNELPQGDTSPVGSKQNKIPDPMNRN
jgi:hypothetical protein